MEIKVKLSGVDEAIKKFNNKDVARATFSALNETARSTKTKASNLIRNEQGFKILKSDLDQRIKLIPAYSKSGEIAKAALEISRYIGSKKASFALPYFGAKEVRKYSSGVIIKSRKNLNERKKKSRFGQGVTVQILKGGQIARYPRAFIAKMKSGHIGVFRNVGKTEGKASTGKDKIREVKVITVMTMFSGIIDKLGIYAKEYFSKRLRSKLQQK